MLMLIARKFIKDNIDTNLNTSHVNVNHLEVLRLKTICKDLNTSHVNVNRSREKDYINKVIDLNTSHVNVNHSIT